MSETQSQLDLNLENYELFDILHVYGVPYDFTDHHIRIASNKLDQINSAKDQLDAEIPLFYHKSFVIIQCIHKFREQQKLLNERYLSNHNDDGEILKTILQTDNFQNYDSILDLLNVILKNNNNLVRQNHNNRRLHDEIQNRINDAANISNLDNSNNSKDRSVNYFDNANTDKQNRNIIDTYSNEAAPGKINSLKRIVQMKNVHINSCFREKYILEYST